MSYPINYPTPQGANVQIFQAPARVGATFWTTEWVKPQGASFVWFTLIGAGGGTDTSATNSIGGGSGAVTNFMGPAFLIPDVLQVRVGTGGAASGTESSVRYQQRSGTGFNVLTASGGFDGSVASNGAPSSAPNYFTAMGIYQSTAGQTGVNNSQTPSVTTFLSGGVFSSGPVANYGYSATTNGFFQMQPIIVGVGGGDNGVVGGIGCGGGGSSGRGGNGLVVIISW
jgi:hypothetical protein